MKKKRMALFREDRPWTNQKSKFNQEEDVVNNSKTVFIFE